MKKSDKTGQPRNKKAQMEALLAEAMKQPGLNDVMQVVQASEVYMQAADAFYSLTEQQKYPAFISSCHPSGWV